MFKLSKTTAFLTNTLLQPATNQRVKKVYNKTLDRLDKDSQLERTAMVDFKKIFDKVAESRPPMGGKAAPEPYKYDKIFGEGGSLAGAMHGATLPQHMMGSTIGPVLETPGKVLQTWLLNKLGPKPGFGKKETAKDSFTSKAVESAGTSVGKAGVGFLQDMLGKGTSAISSVFDKRERNSILEQLKSEDPIISRADDETLMEAYNTMVRFAPTLSTDKNAVRSYLREAIMTGAGPNYATIKALAEAERAVNPLPGRGHKD